MINLAKMLCKAIVSSAVKIVFLILLTVGFLFVAFIDSSKAYALDMTAGATTWYAWNDMTHSDTGEIKDIDPVFLYGPALSAKFNEDLNLTFVFLYGKFDVKTETDSIKMTRMDSDIALNYKLNDYLKIFAGAKFLGYEIPGYNAYAAGPGLGLSATYPIIENLFLLANLSGFSIWGRDKYSVSGKDYQTAYYEYGFNSTLSLAYYIMPASTAISLGGRYQYYKTVYDDDQSDGKTKFYGVTLSAMYFFSI